MSEQPEDERPQTMHLPDGRTARVVDISPGVIEVEIDEAEAKTQRTKFALAILATGTMVLSAGIGGLFGVFAGLATAGFLLVVVGFMLALT